MKESKIEHLIKSTDFDYLQPYFYNNKYALRCELGQGETEDEYMIQALRRSESIYKILFPNASDAFIFNQWFYDRSYEKHADSNGINAEATELENFHFLLECQVKYPCVVIKDLKTYDEPDNNDFGTTRRNRIICYSKNNIKNDFQIIHRQLKDYNSPEISLVSFENECILSVYDDRGCDIVFSTFEKMKEFYPLLEPFFLDYSREDMEKRLQIK